jgi:hypothetical protein
MKRIMYSKHAIERAYERRVSDKQIELTIVRPDLLEHGEGGRLEAVKRFGTRTIRVVYQDLGSMYVVITVYPDRC